jgi:glucosamine-6-phosphate deaminase
MRQQLGRLGTQQQRQIRADWLSFNLDEYVGLGPHDPHSFKAFMAGQLQGPLGLRPEQVLLPDGLAADPQAEARRYGAALVAAGGGSCQER